MYSAEGRLLMLILMVTWDGTEVVSVAFLRFGGQST